MEKRKLICICCPMGCRLQVSTEEGKVVSVTGNTCPRGAAYAEKEVMNPTRIVTTTVRIVGGSEPVVSVKTAQGIPKEKIFACVRELESVEIEAPVTIGDVIFPNIAGTGVDVLATKNVQKCTKNVHK